MWPQGQEAIFVVAPISDTQSQWCSCSKHWADGQLNCSRHSRVSHAWRLLTSRFSHLALVISLGPLRKARATTHVRKNKKAKQAVTLICMMLFLRRSTASLPWCFVGDEVFRRVYLRRACCGVWCKMYRWQSISDYRNIYLLEATEITNKSGTKTMYLHTAHRSNLSQ